MNNLPEFKTYTLGLLQAKSFRFLKQKGTDLLEKYKVTTTEWAVLGYIFKNKTTSKSELAVAFFFKKSFMTRIIKDLDRKKYLNIVIDKSDKRREILSLSSKGVKFVEETENEIHFLYSIFLSFFDAKELKAYFEFIEKVSLMSDTLSAEDKDVSEYLK